jgi:(1->4)-alpha-D-glucan 1-alpha-D-glucosylmutase
VVDRIATYRWQLTPDHGFDAVAAAAADLAALGVSHVYLSPVAEAVPGSTHGYDVVDPGRLRAELGGEAGFGRLAASCRAAGLGLLVDIVPNHLAAHHTNPWWWDVLRAGPTSDRAEVFDIDWSAGQREGGTVLLPILADHYGRELEAGHLRVEQAGGPDPVVLRYHDHLLPLAPGTLSGIDAAAPDALEDLNADPDRLDALLAQQHYRLARWTVADDEVNYRRFFDVDALVATRADRPAVFDAVHELPLGLVEDGVVDGLRIDHVDGLRDPESYLHRLRGRTGDRAWLVVEKILRPDEELPATWPVDGTTGYEVADLLGGWLTDPTGAALLIDGWRERVGEARSYDEVALESRREVLARNLAADVERIVGALVRVCAGRRRHRDHTRRALHAAVVEVAARAPAYRSYVSPDGRGGLRRTPADVRFVTSAVGSARQVPTIDPDLLDLIEDLLLGRLAGEAEQDVALGFQQLTGPAAAKGEEDRALYRWVPLPHRCEVGADPGRAHVGAGEWHAAATGAHERWPDRLTTLGTHDTKRSADARARLAVLATVPAETLDAFDRWWAAAQERAAGGAVVDAAHGWLTFQALVGGHPMSLDRALAVVEKSVREAARRTTWTRPDDEFEAAIRRLVELAVEDPVCRAAVAGLVERIADAACVAALAQLAAQLLAPGVPDLYQGAEAWDHSLVDPDNRRPVDAGRRRRLLDLAAATDPVEAWADPGLRAGGLPRLVVIQAALGLRRRHPDAFGAGAGGAYCAIEATGPDAGRVLAFGRGGRVAVVVTRPGSGARLGADADVDLPPGTWRDVLTGASHHGRVAAGQLFGGFPVSLLELDGAS